MRREENPFADRKEFDPKSNVLEYSCEKVIHQYATEYQKTLEEAKVIRKRLMMFLESFRTTTTKSLDDDEVDGMYHTFLIYTREYRMFCLKHF
jgi:hypothetical protein